MGFLFSVLLIAVGAVFFWGLHRPDSGVNLDAVGLVLMGTGLIWFVVSLIVSGVVRDRESAKQRVVHLGDSRDPRYRR